MSETTAADTADLLKRKARFKGRWRLATASRQARGTSDASDLGARAEYFMAAARK
jgi:hypothetical protein